MIAQFRHILEYNLLEVGNIEFRVLSILQLLILLAFGRLFIFVIQRIIRRQIRTSAIDQRKGYAISQIITYLLWVLVLVLALDTLGLPITVLIAGSTALFVGLGLGMQDTFRDLISGVLILMERTVTANDIIELESGVIGRVREVNLRTTLLETREDVVVVVPNQQLTRQNVVNWTQNKNAVRFAIDVGVAYGSDTRKVEQILLKCARQHPLINIDPGPLVHFFNFGNSSLDFRLWFYSDELFRIERAKSDIRFHIDAAFREEGIVIPFPQRDVWLRQSDPTGSNPDSGE